MLRVDGRPVTKNNTTMTNEILHLASHISPMLLADTAPVAVAASPFLAFKGGLACLGAAIGVGLTGSKAAEAVGRNPNAFGKILVIGILGMAFAEAVAFYGLYLG
jgi:F-type H+-transporting ATPase subunit c